MKKLDTATKRKIRNFILIQLFLLLLYFRAYEISGPVKPEEITTKTIIVEKVELYRPIYYHSIYCQVHSEGIIYTFPSFGIIGDEFSSRELYEKISVGESIDIAYIKTRNLFEPCNFIIAAKNENCVYIEDEEYTGIGLIITMSLVTLLEIFFIWVNIYDIYELRDKIRKHYSRKKKKKKKAEQRKKYAQLDENNK